MGTESIHKDEQEEGLFVICVLIEFIWVKKWATKGISHGMARRK